jgi:endonuclease/exonuclease/phosphatase family metal-dependent hydrolase
MLPEGGSRLAADRRLRVVTYNVHACVGSDGIFRPQRIREILEELRADFIGIQELEDRVLGDEPVSEYLARTLGMHAYRGATLKREDAHYGNLLLSREPASTICMHDISVQGREPRGVIEAGYNLCDRRVRVLVTHFGLKVAERRKQARDLLRVIDVGNADVDVLLGDLNEWRPVSYTVKRGTWPAGRPLLPLDSICVAPDAVRRTVRVMNSTAARRASDHLPLVCDLELPG